MCLSLLPVCVASIKIISKNQLTLRFQKKSQTQKLKTHGKILRMAPNEGGHFWHLPWHKLPMEPTIPQGLGDKINENNKDSLTLTLFFNSNTSAF